MDVVDCLKYNRTREREKEMAETHGDKYRQHKGGNVEADIGDELLDKPQDRGVVDAR